MDSPNLSAPPVHETPTRVRYAVLGFPCSLPMITYLAPLRSPPVAPQIRKGSGLTEVEKGLLFGPFPLPSALFGVPRGWLGDVFGPRRTLIRIVLWWSVFTALTGLIHPLPNAPWFAFTAMLLVRF